MAFQDLGSQPHLDKAPVAAAEKQKRLNSLDTFRGLSLIIMIFNHYGSGGYWFFDGNTWNGLTVADLVFPWFIWIMGVSMAFSFRGLFKRKTPLGEIMIKICRRTAILFAIGLCIETNLGRNEIATLRIPNVLQRFSISYFVIASLELAFGRKTDHELTIRNGRFAVVREILLFWPQWVVSLLLVVLWLLVTFLLPVPGCPTGYLGPGGLADDGNYTNCTGGAAGYIDRLILTDNHMFHWITCKEVYQTEMKYDPEGILGYLTSIFMVFLGMQAGKIILVYKDNKNRLLRWWTCGVVTGAIAAILCHGSKEGGWIPVNKNLWSLSFVLALSSMAFFLLSFLYIVIDMKEWWEGQPIIYPGMNSIVIYICHYAFGDFFPVTWQIETRSHMELLFQNIWGISIWVFVAFLLHYKGIMINI